MSLKNKEEPSMRLSDQIVYELVYSCQIVLFFFSFPIGFLNLEQYRGNILFGLKSLNKMYF